MDLFIIAIILIAVIGVVIRGIFMFFVGRTIVRGIARSMSEFQAMDAEGMYRTLLHLQQSGQYQVGQQYMNSLGDGPVTSQIRGMAAAEGMSLDF